MEIEVVRQVNSRWSDGRTFAAMPGRRVTLDESDVDAVAHMRHLIGTGDVVEIEPEESPTPDGGDAAEVVDKTHKPARKSTAAKAASDQ